jgi:hypothetical protein
VRRVENKTGTVASLGMFLSQGSTSTVVTNNYVPYRMFHAPIVGQHAMRSLHYYTRMLLRDVPHLQLPAMFLYLSDAFRRVWYKWINLRSNFTAINTEIGSGIQIYSSVTIISTSKPAQYVLATHTFLSTAAGFKYLGRTISDQN